MWLYLFTMTFISFSSFQKKNSYVRLAYANKKLHKPNIIKVIYIGHKIHDVL